MRQRAIRGAITVDSNTVEAINEASLTLIKEIVDVNGIDVKDICHAIFTMTNDLDAVYPAKIVREKLSGWEFVPMMCVAEQNVKNSLKLCLRVLIVINTGFDQDEMTHVYLKGATVLRPDLSKG